MMARRSTLLLAATLVFSTLAPTAAQSVLNADSTPLIPAIEATCRALHQRVWVLPGTPDTAQIGDIVAGDHRATLARLLDLNGLVAHLHNGVLVIGTPQAMDARFGSFTAHSELIPVVGLDPATVAATLQPQLPGTVILPDAARHALYVSGSAYALRQVHAFVSPLEQADYSVARFALHSGADPGNITNLLHQLALPADPESIAVDPSGGAVLVYGPSTYQQQVQHILSDIDRTGAQVLYDVDILEVDPVQLAHNLGISVGQSQTQYQAVGLSPIAQAAPPAFGQAIFGFPLNRGLNLAGELDLLETHGSARLIRHLQMVASNGTQASDGFTEQVPYQVQTINGFSVTTGIEYKQVGVTVTLVPQIGDTTIGTAADLSYSTVAGVQFGAPVIADRHKTTRVTTTDGQLFLLGGLKAEDFTKTTSGIPILDRLPIIGALFRHQQDQRNEQEIVMLIRAKRIDATNRFDAHHYPATTPYVMPTPAAPLHDDGSQPGNSALTPQVQPTPAGIHS